MHKSILSDDSPKGREGLNQKKKISLKFYIVALQ